MTMISMEKKVAEDLLNSKLRIIIKEMEKILTKWNFHSVNKFLDDARKGIIRNAEDDAIVLRNLIDERENLIKIKESWK